MSRSWLSQMVSTIADRGLPWVRLPTSAAAPLDQARGIALALIGERGEAAGTALARELVELYHRLAPEEKLGFLELVAADFGPDEEKLRAAASAYAEGPSTERLLALSALVEPPRQELLRRMNMAPSGTATLVGMRETLLGHLKAHPALQVVEADLRHLLASWFNRGFLQLERIDWRTPAVILEKLIAYEAVHEIQGWDDLRRRLASDRRCFAFFHPALRDEPLIFVEIALTNGIATSVQDLLVPEPAQGARRRAPDAAIFYSISNCQPGLRGISFGNFLIKQVVSELRGELPSLKIFSTLSPVPGFRGWLDRQIAQGAPNLLTADEHATLAAAAGRKGAKGALKALLARPDWPSDAASRGALEAPLRRLCAEYLLGLRSARGTTDPVARFHLGNGARLEQVDFLGDTSPNGLKQAYGMMVNYRYELAEIEANHEAFVRDGTVARSSRVDRLVAGSRPPPPKPAAARASDAVPAKS